MRIRFLDDLSPGAQQKYVDQREKRREEKKTKLEEISDNGGSSSNIDTKFEQPLASLLASQTAENTEYNRSGTRKGIFLSDFKVAFIGLSEQSAEIFLFKRAKIVYCCVSALRSYQFVLRIIYNFTAESSPANRSHQHNLTMERLELEVETKEMEEEEEVEEREAWKVV